MNRNAGGGVSSNLVDGEIDAGEKIVRRELQDRPEHVGEEANDLCSCRILLDLYKGARQPQVGDSVIQRHAALLDRREGEEGLWVINVLVPLLPDGTRDRVVVNRGAQQRQHSLCRLPSVARRHA